MLGNIFATTLGTWVVLIGVLLASGAVGFFVSKRVPALMPLTLAGAALIGVFAIFMLIYGIAIPVWLKVSFCALIGSFAGWGISEATTKPEEPPTPPPPQKIQFTWCPSCAAPLEERDFGGKMKKACTVCKFVHWNNPMNVAVALVPSLDGQELLLIRRAIPPRIGFFALPGGYVDTNEGLQDAAIREVFEETGLKIEVDSFFWSIPVAGKNEILTFFVCRVVGGTISISAETDKVEFFKLDKLPGEIAFPLHRQAIDMWLASRKH